MTLTDPGSVPGNALLAPATVTTTGAWSSPSVTPVVGTAPKKTTRAPGESRTPAIPPPVRPCGRTEAADTTLTEVAVAVLAGDGGGPDFGAPPSKGWVLSDQREFVLISFDHWETQMSFHVGMPSVLSSLSPLIFDPWAWAMPV